MKNLKTLLILATIILSLVIPCSDSLAFGCPTWEDPVFEELEASGLVTNDESCWGYVDFVMRDLYAFYNPRKEAYHEANKDRAVAGSEYNFISDQTVEYFHSKGGAWGYYELYLKSKCQHTYVENSRTDATCTQKGSINYTCSSCGVSKSETITAKGHNYRKTIASIAPTCTEDGINDYICITCADHHTETVPALGHKTSPVNKALKSIDGTTHPDVDQCVRCSHSKEYTRSYSK